MATEVIGYTIENYNALVAAMATGAKAVKYSDKEIVYRTLDEMRDLKAAMELDLGINSKSKRDRRIGTFYNR